MAGFIQVMEFDTSKIGEIDVLARELSAAMGDKFKPHRATTTQDRDRPGHYYIIVEFDSYDDAMKNSDDPLTGEYAEKMAQLINGSTDFHNLDVVSVMEP
jgi:hypothetical protein